MSRLFVICIILGVYSLSLIGCVERGSSAETYSHRLDIVKVHLSLNDDGHHWSGSVMIKNTTGKSLLIAKGSITPGFISFGDEKGGKITTTIDDKNLLKISVPRNEDVYYYSKANDIVKVAFQIPLEYQLEENDLDKKSYETNPSNGGDRILTFWCNIYIIDPLTGNGLLTTAEYKGKK